MFDIEIFDKLPYGDKLLGVFEIFDEWIPESITVRALLVGCSAGLLVYYLLKRKYRLPPGPRGWPIVGSALEFNKVPIYKKLVEWQKIYGPIVTFKAGPISIVTLNTIDVVNEALVKRQADFAGRPLTYSILKFTDGGRSIVLSDYSPAWKLHRKLSSKALRHYMTGTLLEEGIENSLLKGIELLKEQKGAFNPLEIISFVVFNIINNICFNDTRDIDDAYFQEMLKILDAFNNEAGNGFIEDFIPPLRLCPTKKMRKMLSYIDIFTGHMNAYRVKHKDTLDRDNLRDFTDMILVAQEDAQRNEDPEVMAQITDRHVTQTLTDIFAAGMDTSRYTLTWCLLYIAANPDVQEKIHKEVDLVLGGRQCPKIMDRNNLAYTEAVLYESMRASTLVPLGLPHKAICDSHLGEYDVPKETMIFINHYALHNDPNYWDEPDVFRPERFLDANGKIAPKPESWLPFSMGRRGCLGESVAKPELHLLLAGLMRNFKIFLPEGVKASFEGIGGSSFINIPNDYKIFAEARI